MKLFSIGYISHDPDVYAQYLGPSIDALAGPCDIITTPDIEYPAHYYNLMLGRCETPYLILTHEDVSFPANILDRISSTIDKVPGFGALGMVGKTKDDKQQWSRVDGVIELDTLDCCFICIKKDTQARFDEDAFGEYHLYVEDFCAQLNRLYGQKIYTIQTESCSALNSAPTGWLSHHGATYIKKGARWGRYKEFKRVLLQKWPDIKTT